MLVLIRSFSSPRVRNPKSEASSDALHFLLIEATTESLREYKNIRDDGGSPNGIGRRFLPYSGGISLNASVTSIPLPALYAFIARNAMTPSTNPPTNTAIVGS